MKVHELIEWLKKLNQDWDVHVEADGEKEIGGIEPSEANREYLIWPSGQGE